MERRTGLVKGVVKPPIAPKPKNLPPAKPNFPPALKYALNLDDCQPQINTVKPQPKPCVFQTTTPHLVSKPVAPESEHQVGLHFQQSSETHQCVGLLNSRNGFQYKTDINKGRVLSTASADGAVCDLSINQPEQMHGIQSHRTVKHNQNFTVANGLAGSEKHPTKKHQSSSGAASVSSTGVTGSTPKTSVSISVLINKLQRCQTDAEQNGHSFSGVVPVRRHPPIPLQKKTKSTIAGQQETLGVDSEQLRSPVKPRLKINTVKESTLAHFQEEGLPSVTSIKRAGSEKKYRRRDDDSVQLSVSSPRFEVFSPDPKQIPDVPSNCTPDSTPSEKTGSNQKPKVKSFCAEDRQQHDVQKTPSFKRIKDIDLTVKKLPKLFSKAGEPVDVPAAYNEESVDAGSRDNRKQSSTPFEIQCYRSHQVEVHGKGSLFKEECVDGDEDEHLYEDIPEYLIVPTPHSTGVESQQPNPIWRSHFSKGSMDEKQNFHIESSNISTQQYADSHIYEGLDSSDDTHSEREFDSSSEEDSDNSTFDKKDSKTTKLAHIAKEIMSSEKVFVDVLKLLHINFRDAVTKASVQAGKPVIDERTLNQILFSLPQFYELNCNLLSELEDRVAHWNEHPAIADIFLKKGPYLKMYTSYICEFDKNVALLEEHCRKNPAFAKVVQEFESSPRCANLAVKHYMLKPIQRLPQYQLLLTDYLKNLDEDSPEYQDAQAALNIVKEVANHANETMRQGDQFQKLMQVQCSLIGYHEIVKPGRALLKQGTLLKLSRKVMQPRMFFLFNDALLYAMPLQSGQYKVNNELSLAGMKVSKPSQEAYQNELNIESTERSFILSASSPAVRDEWLEAITKAIDEYTKRKISFFSSKGPEEGDIDSVDSTSQLGAKAPIWIPDLRATMCMICTCEFTLTWRRHHCRACGRVVCQACSMNSHPLEYLKNCPARVCDQCFEVLQHNKSGYRASDRALLSPNSKSFHFRKQKKIPAALKEVSANTDESSMSGYLERMKGRKKQWKRLWFVIKNKVLYTYAASEDVAALESLPLLGFSLRSVSESSQKFSLYHKDKLFYIFKTDDALISQRWIQAFNEAMIL